jgi:hypothetical protein
MTDPFAGEFDDVLALLSHTEIPMPTQLQPPPSARSTSQPAERLDDLEAAVLRDADEAWSLAMAFLGDEDAAWDALVAGFVVLGRDALPAITPADSLLAVARAALDAALLLTKAGALPERPGADLGLEPRLGILLQAGLRLPGLELKGLPPLDRLLTTAFPRPGHARGEELCQLLARELLGELDADALAALDALTQAHPTSAALLRQRYADLAEVAPLVMPRRSELAAQVQEQLERASSQAAKIGALQLKISVSCAYCHDGLDREHAVFCGSCLAPHHDDCFATHGRCSAAGCDHTQVVRAGAPAPAQSPRRRRPPLWPLLAAAVGLGTAAAWGLVDKPGDLAVAPPRPTLTQTAPAEVPAALAANPELLREALARTAEAQAKRDAEHQRNLTLEHELEQQEITLNFDETPFAEAVDFLRDITKLNYVISAGAREIIRREQVTVSLRLREISLLNAVRLILASHQAFEYRFERGVVVIGIYHEGGEELLLEAYDISDVISGAVKAQGGFAFDPDRFLELLEQVLGEYEPHGSTEIAGGMLVMRQPEWIHKKVRNVLAYLRGEEDAGSDADPAWIAALEERLERKTVLNFQDAPITELVTYLQDVTGANITLSPSVDAEETLVTLRLRDITAMEALRVTLEQTGLAMLFENETLKITELQEARGEFILRLIDVADLSWLEPEQLVTLVSNGIGEDMWGDPATIDAHRGQLIVNQTRHGHEQVDDVLAKLRISRARAQGELPQEPQ